jgi:hypothetical protein
MKRPLLFFVVLSLTLVAASVASAQTRMYCVKPDGAPIAAIVMPYGSNHDPSVVCNAVVPQCFLTCGAVAQMHSGTQNAPAPNVPIVTVTAQMLSGLGSSGAESPELCAKQYQSCLAKCRGDRSCAAYCESVRSGCGTANRGQ